MLKASNSSLSPPETLNNRFDFDEDFKRNVKEYKAALWS